MSGKIFAAHRDCFDVLESSKSRKMDEIESGRSPDAPQNESENKEQ